MPNDHTAAAWLMSLEPALARLAAEARAEAELHQAHVLAWMDAPACACCGDTKPRMVKLKRYWLCAECNEEGAE